MEAKQEASITRMHVVAQAVLSVRLASKEGWPLPLAGCSTSYIDIDWLHAAAACDSLAHTATILLGSASWKHATRSPSWDIAQRHLANEQLQFLIDGR